MSRHHYWGVSVILLRKWKPRQVFETDDASGRATARVQPPELNLVSAECPAHLAEASFLPLKAINVIREQYQTAFKSHIAFAAFASLTW